MRIRKNDFLGARKTKCYSEIFANMLNTGVIYTNMNSLRSTNETKLSIKPNKKYVFLRNPHLSRNDQVLLRAYVKRKSLREKIFTGHVVNILELQYDNYCYQKLANGFS